MLRMNPGYHSNKSQISDEPCITLIMNPPESGEEQDVMELVPNIILNPGFMETDPVRERPRESYAASIIKSTECPGPGKPRRV